MASAVTENTLGFCRAEGRLKYVKLLLENGAKINQAGDEQNRPLMAAARKDTRMLCASCCL
jgi:ankyrin repeat protein